MKAFKDTAGRVWELAVNVATIKRARALAKVDLPGLFEKKCEPLAELLEDPCKLVDVLWTLVAPKPDVTDEQFGASMGGDALEEATNAFLEDLADFFPSQKAANIRHLLRETRRALTRIQERASQEVATLDGPSLADKFLSSLTTSPALSA